MIATSKMADQPVVYQSKSGKEIGKNLTSGDLSNPQRLFLKWIPFSM